MLRNFMMLLFSALMFLNITFNISDNELSDMENNVIQSNLVTYSNKSSSITKIQKTKSDKPTDNLKIDQIPFVYNSLYSLENIKDVDHSISILKNYKYLVCAYPEKLADDELKVIKGIHDTVKIFGYIDMGGSILPDIDVLKSQIDSISDNNWYGVFIDQFGYDFGETRQRQNIIVDYIHSKGLTCFVNSWFIDDSLGNKIDSVHNPGGVKTKLGENDWYLMESFYVSSSGYLQDKTSFLEKCTKAQKYKKDLGIKIAALSYKNNLLSWESSGTDIENSYMITLLMGFDGWWFADKLEDDSFLHGNPSDLNVGNKLIKPLNLLADDHYTALTDKYYIVYNFKNYPEVNFSTFEINSIKKILSYIIKLF